MNKPKKQGTSFESSLVNKLIAEGYSDAKRLAEGGSNDIGDIEFTADSCEFVIEAKARQNLNVTQELFKAKQKAHKKRPSAIVILAWKKLVGSGKRRKPDGERIVYVIDEETLLWLLQSSD